MTSTEPRDDHRLAEVAGSAVLAVRVRATARNVAEVRRLVSAFASTHGARDGVLGNIALAVSEAITNAVVHGAGRDPERLIEVVADVEDQTLEILIGDDGPGLAADVESDGLGLGLGLIARTASRFDVGAREPRGTQVWMRFELA